MGERDDIGIEKVSIKDSRKIRREKEQQGLRLHAIVKEFAERRGQMIDPNGPLAEDLFVELRNKWISICNQFNNKNKHRKAFSLRYEAFAEQIEKIYAQERAEAAEQAKRAMDLKFKNWFRRERVWKTHFFLSLRFYLRSKVKKIDVMDSWRAYFDLNIQ